MIPKVLTCFRACSGVVEIFGSGSYSLVLKLAAVLDFGGCLNGDRVRTPSSPQTLENYEFRVLPLEVKLLEKTMNCMSSHTKLASLSGHSSTTSNFLQAENI